MKTKEKSFLDMMFEDPVSPQSHDIIWKILTDNNLLSQKIDFQQDQENTVENSFRSYDSQQEIDKFVEDNMISKEIERFTSLQEIQEEQERDQIQGIWMKSLFDVSAQKFQKAQKLLNEFESDYLQENNNQQENLNSQQKQDKQELQTIDEFPFKIKSLFDVDPKKLQKAHKLLESIQIQENIQNTHKENFNEQKQAKTNKENECQIDKQQEEECQQYQMKSLFNIDQNKLKKAQELLDNIGNKKVKNIEQKNCKQIQRQIINKVINNKRTSIDRPVIKKQKYIANKELMFNIKKIKDYTNKLSFNPKENPFVFRPKNFEEQKYLLDISYGIQKCMSQYGFDHQQVSLKFIHSQYQLLYQLNRVSKNQILSKENFIQFCIQEISFRFWRLKIKREKSILQELKKTGQQFKPYINLLLLQIQIKNNKVQLVFTDGFATADFFIDKVQQPFFYQLLIEGKLVIGEFYLAAQVQYISVEVPNQSKPQRTEVILFANLFFKSKVYQLGQVVYYMLENQLKQCYLDGQWISSVICEVVEKGGYWLNNINTLRKINISSDYFLEEYISSNDLTAEQISQQFSFYLDVQQNKEDQNKYRIYFRNQEVSFYDYFQKGFLYQFQLLKICWYAFEYFDAGTNQKETVIKLFVYKQSSIKELKQKRIKEQKNLNKIAKFESKEEIYQNIILVQKTINRVQRGPNLISLDFIYLDKIKNTQNTFLCLFYYSEKLIFIGNIQKEDFCFKKLQLICFQNIQIQCIRDYTLNNNKILAVGFLFQEDSFFRRKKNKSKIPNFSEQNLSFYSEMLLNWIK